MINRFVNILARILRWMVDNHEKFYLEDDDPDVLDAKALLDKMEGNE